MTETPEFSRVIFTSRLSPNGSSEELRAKPEEREALAKRFELIELTALTAQLTLKPSMQLAVKVTGKIQAEYSQRCVVTLEPILATCELDVEVNFVRAEEQINDVGPVEPDELEEEVDYFENGRIDLGEMVAQQFGISLDPYPRKPGAALSVTSFGVQPIAEKPQPFAGLVEAIKNAKRQDKSDS
jgi:uncharacterized metal-binding protein YceD (DUF177 family)